MTDKGVPLGALREPAFGSADLHAASLTQALHVKHSLAACAQAPRSVWLTWSCQAHSQAAPCCTFHQAGVCHQANVCAVQWRHSDTPNHSVVASDTTVDVDLVVPRWFILPKVTVQKTGNAVMRAILRQAVPKFLAQLERDYMAWRDGDESRQPLGEADFLEHDVK